MGFLMRLFYGFISGLTEFLPISSQAHQALLLHMLGYEQRQPLMDLFVHIGLLVAVFLGNRTQFLRIRRLQNLHSRRRSKGSNQSQDMRIVKSAALPMLIIMLLYLIADRFAFQSVPLSILFIINGILLIIPEHMRHGNKDARLMSGFDGILLGIFSALSFLPGISRVGAGMSYTVARGADRQHAVNWIMLLSVPALLLFIIFDIVGLFSIGVIEASFGSVIGSILSAVTAFIGGYLSIVSLRTLADKAGFSGFAYYSWGIALFTFVLYLIT